MKRMIISGLILTIGWILIGFLTIGDGFGGETAGLTRTHSGGGVRVKVTYLNPQHTDGPRFKVALDTHSVNLDAYNLKSQSLLRDGTGKAYDATEAEDQGGGHHRTVTLYFPEIAAGTQRVELIIKDLAGIKERFFRWEF
jgi:hypothetical protein